MVDTYVKRNFAAPQGFFACEAAGLQWLAKARGATCAQVIGYDDTSVTLVRHDSCTPTAKAARAFGKALARTHAAGADGWGAPPDDWKGPGYFGPLNQPMPMSLNVHDTWGSFYAQERLAPMLVNAVPALGGSTIRDIVAVIERCRAGDFDSGESPARLHGDLWSGNLLWTRKGVVMIDPAAHGGHRETDIAMLHLFGCPHLDAVIEGYQHVHALASGWRERIPLHQLYPLLAHAALFGVGYAHQTHDAARQALNLPSGGVA